MYARIPLSGLCHTECNLQVVPVTVPPRDRAAIPLTKKNQKTNKDTQKLGIWKFTKACQKQQAKNLPYFVELCSMLL